MFSFAARVKRYVNRTLRFHKSNEFRAIVERVRKLEEENQNLIQQSCQLKENYQNLYQRVSDLGVCDQRIQQNLAQISVACSMKFSDLMSTDAGLGNKGISFLKRLQPFDVENVEFVRIGRENDGGYVMADDFATIDAAYSFGINDDVAWDLAMAKKGIPIFMFDHTIDRLPENHELFHWKKIGVGPTDRHDDKLMTLRTLLIDNGHDKNMNLILKMDVENAEWDSFAATDPSILGQFKQIVIELHFNHLDDPCVYNSKMSVLDKILEYHLPIHIHANNYDYCNIIDGIPIPNLFEVTFARKSSYTFRANTRFFPGPLDSRCVVPLPEYSLPYFL